MILAYRNTQIFFKAAFLRLPASWRWCLSVWGISRLALAVWGALLWSLKMVPLPRLRGTPIGVIPAANSITSAWMGVWHLYDVVYYYKIAAEGYTLQHLSAFFPLFPLIGRYLGRLLGGNYLASLMIVSNLALLLGLVLLYQMIASDSSESNARWTIIILITFPGAFFYFAGYPCSLIFLETVVIYWAARKEGWFLAGLVGVLAGLTHATTWLLFFLIAPLAIQSWRKNPEWYRVPVFLAPFTPFLGIGLFLAWRISQGFMDFMALQTQDWGKIFIPFWMIIPLALQETYFSFRIWLNIALFVLALCLTPLVWKRSGWSMALFLLSSALFLASSADYTEPVPSFIRFILPTFPLFMGIAFLLKEKTRYVAYVFGVLQLLLCGLFLMWLWVA